MKKLLAIVGPTATGKTARAIQESLACPSIIVSADSRQMFRTMDIVTGKDHPSGITIYGIDILDPDETSSVSVWYDAVIPHIEQAWREDKQVIVVGGTGLYVKALTEGIDTMKVPINQALRDELNLLSVAELQQRLDLLSPEKYQTMNHSDSHNPRRLIRAIEIACCPTENRTPAEQGSNLLGIHLNIIGLKQIDDVVQRQKIQARVISRIELGAIEETKQLLTKYDPRLKAMTAIGYTSIIKFLKGELSKQDLISNWVADEVSYAKRQMTWFRKQPTIWYDVS